jgi:hypothetical protein
MTIYKKNFFFYFFLYITLLVGFTLDENSSGGAIYDFQIISKVVNSFVLNFNKTFNNYADFSITHFPYYYIFLSFVYKIFDSFYFVKLFVLHLSLFLPWIFYKILSLRFGKQNNLYLFYIPGILFISSYFRSSAIWALNDNIALIFFSLAIFFYQKAIKQKEEKKFLLFSFLNLLMLVLASYTRQYYAIFWLFFIYKFYLLSNYKRILIFYIFISLIFSLPVLNGLFFGAAYLSNTFFSVSKNLFNNTILIPNIFFIYLLPIYLNIKNVKKLFFFYKDNIKYLFLNLFIIIILTSFYDYISGPGGGIIFKLFYYESFPYLFYLISFFSYLVIFHFCFFDFKNNYLIILIIIFMFPFSYIFQKYLDPLSLILIFSLFKSEILDDFIFSLKDNIKYLYLYFSFLYFSSLCYYYL